VADENVSLARSVHAAVVARLPARVGTRSTADEAFLTGLVHEVGPSFGSLAMDKPTFAWLIRAADIDVRLMTIAFGV
jgi:hypothetical protein